MKRLIKLLIISCCLTIVGCGLDRSNPLDPAGNNINTPKIVTGIELNSSGQGASNKYIIISWTPLQENEANGYFIYRSRSFDGSFDLVTEIRDRVLSSYKDTYKIVSGPIFTKCLPLSILIPLNLMIMNDWKVH